MRSIDFDNFWIPSFAYFNPQVHAFKAITSAMGMKQWELKEESFPSGVSYLRGSRTYSCSLERLLLASEVALTNAETGNAVEAWFSVIKNTNLFSSDSYLRAESYYGELDSHIKTIVSDEVGMGASVCILGDHYDVKFLANAGHFIRKTVTDPTSRYYNLSFASLGMYGKNGKYEPDFFCLTSKNEAVVAEAKGTFGSYSRLAQPLNKGKQQVSNVTPVGIPLRANASRLVIATQIPIKGVNRKTTLPHSIIKDPESNNALEVVVTPDQIIRSSISQALGFSGYRRAAANFFANRPINDWLENIENSEIEVENRVFNPILYIRDGWFLAFEKNVIQAIKLSEQRKIKIADMLSENHLTNERLDYLANDSDNIKLLPMGFGLVRESNLEQIWRFRNKIKYSN